jgi:protein-histidine pros-kinase
MSELPAGLTILRKAGAARSSNAFLRNIADSFMRITPNRQLVEQMFRYLVDTAPDAIVVVDCDRRVALVNRRAEVLFGYRRDELLGQGVEALVPERFRDSDRSERYFAAPKPLRFGAGVDLYGLRQDGSEFPVEVSVNPWWTEQGVVVSAAIRDITERIRAEDKFRDLLESAPDAMVIVGTEGLITLVNRQAEVLFGYRRDELVGQPVELLVPEALRDRHPVHRDRYFAGPKARPMGDGLQLHAMRRDGSEFPVEVSLGPLKTEGGTMVSAAIRDVTDRRRTEHTLRRVLARERDAAERLRGVDRLKDEFLSTVSHDLRTPLTVISALAEALLRSPDRQDRAELLERIFQSASEMGAMIEQLLDHSRLEAGKVALEAGPVPLRDAIERCIDLARPAMAMRLVAVEVPGDLKVNADQRGLERIVVNLLDNAAKYSPADSTIRIAAQAEGDQATVAIEDHGSGIDRAEQDRIFERFYQGSAVSVKRGTGVGLSIVRRYVELLGGEVWVESRGGQGSTFRFTLPLFTEAQ